MDYDPDARGFIDKPTVIVGEGPTGQSKEWVASNAAVENPTVGPILDMIDKSQQAGTIRTLDLNQVIRSKMAGFSSGGSISQPMSFTETPKDSGGGVALPPELMEKFAKAVINMNENGVKAPVVLSDLKRNRHFVIVVAKLVQKDKNENNEFKTGISYQLAPGTQLEVERPNLFSMNGESKHYLLIYLIQIGIRKHWDILMSQECANFLQIFRPQSLPENIFSLPAGYSESET